MNTNKAAEKKRKESEEFINSLYMGLVGVNDRKDHYHHFGLTARQRSEARWVDYMESELINSLSEDQKEAFNALLNMKSRVDTDERCAYFFQGIRTGRKLMEIMHDPDEFLGEADACALSLENACGWEVEVLTRYLEKQREGSKL